MATGISAAMSNAALNALCRNVTWTQPVAFYVKLHTADPGASGATAAAGNTTRVAATFGAALAGSLTTTGAVAWTNVSTAETYSHVSFWDAVTVGNFLGSNALTTPRAVAIGDNFTIAIGALTIGITPVAA